MRATYRTLVLTAASVLLAACTDSPLQPAATQASPTAAAAIASPSTRHVAERVVDWSDSYFSFACSADGEVVDPEEGELVRMEGQMHVREVFMQDAAGNHHMQVHTRPLGMRGIGVASGEEFRVSERQIGGAIQTTTLLAGHYRSVQTFVGLDTGRRFSLVTAGHYTVDTNGVPVVTRDATTLSCRI